MKKFIPKKSILLSLIIFIALGAIITYAATGGGWLFKSTEAKGLVGRWPLDNVSETTGSELVTNGTFDTNINGWTIKEGTGGSWSAGSLAFDWTTTVFYQAVTVTTGKKYRISVNHLTGGTSVKYFMLGTDAPYNAPGYYAYYYTESLPVGIFTKDIIATSGTLYVTVGSAGSSSTWDNISVKEIQAGDVTPNKNNGSLYGTATTTDRMGQSSRAISFDGSDDWIDVNSSFGKPETLTISLWFKTTDNTQDNGLFGMSDVDPPSAASGYVPVLVIQDNGTIRAEYWSGAIANNITTAASYNDGQWHQVVFVGNDLGTPTEILYVDGVQVGTWGVAGNIDNSWWTNTQIGTGYDGAPSLRTGGQGATAGWLYGLVNISDVRVYNRALSAAEVSELYGGYRSTAHAASQSKGIIGHWPLDSNSETVGNEMVANGNIEATPFSSSWSIWDATQAVETTSPHAGSQAVQVTGTNVQGHSYQWISPAPTAGKLYKLTGWMKATSGDRVRIKIYDNDHSSIVANSDWISSTNWTQYTVYFTHPAGCNTLGVFLEIENIGDIGYFDDITLREVRASDITPNMNYGTDYGATYTTDQNGQTNRAMSFDGTTDYIELPRTDIIGAKANYTISAWVKRNTGVGGSIYGEYYSPGSETKNYFSVQSSGIYGLDQWPPSGTGGGVLGTTAVPENIWTHIVVAVDSTNEYYYFNGAADGSGVIEAYSGNTPNKSAIGARAYDTQPGGWYQFFGGSISDLRIYDRTLTAAEIKTIYDSYRPKISSGSLTKGLVGEWTLKSKNLKSTTLMADVTPFSNHGTLVAGPVVGVASTTFDGVDDYVDVGTLPGMDFSQSYTVGLWLYLNRFGDLRSNCTAPDQRSVVFAKQTGYYGVKIITSTNNQLSLYHTDSANTTQAIAISPPLNTWMHIVVMFDKTVPALRMYKDGVLVGSDTDLPNPLINPTGSFYIGAQDANCSYDFTQGAISDLKIYNRALSSSEVKLLYDKGM